MVAVEVEVVVVNVMVEAAVDYSNLIYYRFYLQCLIFKAYFVIWVRCAILTMRLFL